MRRLGFALVLLACLASVDAAKFAQQRVLQTEAGFDVRTLLARRTESFAQQEAQNLGCNAFDGLVAPDLSFLGEDLSSVAPNGSEREKLLFCLVRLSLQTVTDLSSQTTSGSNAAEFELNYFSVLTEEEAAPWRGFVDLNLTIPSSDDTSSSRILQSVPNDKTWVGTAVSSTVLNQGSCGSCWAFSATEMISAMLYLRLGTYFPLSQQQLVSCDDDQSNGCSGGNYFAVWGDYTPENPLTVSPDYPYTDASGSTSPCNVDLEKEGVFEASDPVQLRSGGVLGFATQVASNQQMIDTLLENPLSVAIAAGGSCFHHYKSGILEPSQCDVMSSDQCQLDHAVLLVGYGGLNSANPYWIVKNSWGPSWGENGFMKLAMIPQNDLAQYECAGMLGINEQPGYPKEVRQTGTIGPTPSAAQAKKISVILSSILVLIYGTLTFQ